LQGLENHGKDKKVENTWGEPKFRAVANK